MKSTFLFSLLIVLLFSFDLLGQGKFVLAGGGAETREWADRAYGWGIEHARNKKVGVISYYDESNDLLNYFISLGAEAAENIKISSREQANSDTLYSYLMQFDFLFFKGGDQSNYYNTYTNTQVTNAMRDKYLEGGVLGGTSAGLAIMTGVIFPAINGSVYPEQGLLDITNNRIQLREDFLDLLPGWIGDTHFVERGRHFRLISFLARWYKDHDQLINGFGVDDKTALLIDKDLKATVIGTGAVSFFVPDEFQFREDRFYLDSLFSFQLLDSGVVDLKTLEIIESRLDKNITPSKRNESGNYSIFLSGSNRLADNAKMLKKFSEDIEGKNLVIVSSSKSSVERLLPYLPDVDYQVDFTLTSPEYNGDDSSRIRNQIKKASHLLFYEVSDQLMSFVNGGPTGELIKNHMRRNDIKNAFIGPSSKLAGPYYVTNNTDDDLASYRNALNFEPGLSLLETSCVISNAIDPGSSDFYENNTSAVTFMMANYGLYRGIYLNLGSYIEIKPGSKEITLTQYGDYPTTIINNYSKAGGFASSRNVAGFEKLSYKILLDQQSIDFGIPMASDDKPYSFEKTVLKREHNDKFAIFPNPANEFIVVNNHKDEPYTIVDQFGRPILTGVNKEKIPVYSLKSGYYFVIFNNKEIIESYSFYKRN